MAVINFHNLGLIGIVQDQAPHELPPEAWTSGQNVHFVDNKVVRMSGHEQVFGTPLHAPYALLPVPTVTNFFWMYMGLAKVAVVESTTHEDITPDSDFTGTASNLWTGGLLNGIPIINNGVENPQMWNPRTIGTNLADITAWPDNTTCRIIRPFKTFLIALDVTKATGRDPFMVKWSHTADPGTVPNSWDEADTTKDAGETALADSGGFLLDCLPLGDVNIIYKEDQSFQQQFIGGVAIWKFSKLPIEVGMLASRCVAAFNIGEGPRHFLVTSDDVVVHNGQQALSVVDRKMRRRLFNEMDPVAFTNAYVVPNYPNREMWFCYPTSGNTIPNRVLIYNTITTTLTEKELPNTGFPHIGFGVIDPDQDFNWDAAIFDISWDSLTDPWDLRSFEGSQRKLLAADHTETKLFKIDQTNQFDSLNFTAYIERSGLAIVGQDRQGNPKVDYDLLKLVTKVWIKATGSPFQVRLGSQNIVDGAITYTAAQTFTPGVDRYLDFHLNCRLFTVRFESTADGKWEIHSYDLELEPAGRF